MTEILVEQNKQDIRIRRNFLAEKSLVFKLFTEESLQLKWQSAFLAEFRFVEFNCTNGGRYHSIHKGADGLEYGFKGVYHEIIPYEKIIKTSEFLGLPFKVLPTLEVISFIQDGETTTLNIQIICDSESTRDAMVQHGMQAHFDAIFGEMETLLIA